ncbi:MAG: hypothetical protein GWP91_20675 [Rhodobacterales bacterium]|nr:hypothetical protein [Rhodobacterales bacterium]
MRALSTSILVLITIAGCSNDDKGTQPTGTQVSNHPPTLGSVELTPNPGFESTLLTCQVIGLDDTDGDSVTVSYTWAVNGTDIAATSGTLNGDDFSKSDTVSCTATPNDGFTAGSPVTSNQINILNTPPSGTNVQVGPVPADRLALLTATALGWSDADGDAENWDFAWYVNSTSVGVSGNVLSGAFEKGDEVYAIATPNDLDDLGDPLQSNIITIINTAPTMTGAEVTPGSPIGGDILVCSPSGGADVDGDAVSYTFEWFVNGAAAGSNTELLSAPSFTDGDDVYCVITPTDLEDDGSPVQSNTVTIQNGAPSMASVTLGPEPANEATILTCAPNGLIDPDGDPINLIFSWMVSGLSVGVGTSTLDGTYFDRGQAVQCTVVANDGTSNSAPGISNNVIIQNTPPSASSVAVSPNTPFTVEDVSATVTGWTDLDGDAEGYQYAWDVNGTVVIGETAPTLSAGNYIKHDFIIVTATPDDGTELGVPVISIAVEVQNSLPVIASVDIAPGAPLATDILGCVATGATDADSDTITNQYQWYVNGLPVGSGTAQLPPAAFTSGDEVYCIITPNDGEADGAPVQSGTSIIDNTAPTLANVVLTPDPAFENTLLVCTPSGENDPDGDPLTFLFAWTVNGVPIAATTSTLDGSQFDHGDTVQCTVMATDGAANSAPVMSNNQYISNTAPSAQSIVIGPADPQTYDDVTLFVSGWDDLDNDPEGYLVQWFVNGFELPGETATSLSSTYYAKNDLLYAVATPDDGIDYGVPLVSLEIAVLNTPPTLVSVGVGPANPSASDLLTCTPTGEADDDGDPIALNIEWFVDGVGMGAGTNQLASPGAGSNVYCVVTPNDGDEDGIAIQSNSVTIENSVPTIASVTLTPDPAYEDSVLSCAALGVVDADGTIPTLSYAWTVGGLPMGVITSTLDGTYFDRDQAVQCTVTANDGIVDSASEPSNIVVILNSVPSATSVDIAPVDPTTNDNVFLTVNGWADLDGDAEDYLYQWFVDGIAIPGATSTALPSAFYSKHEFLTVEATPDDGTDLGIPVMSIAVEVLNSPPTLVSASLAPTNPVTTDTLTCSGFGPGDGDGDPVVLGYTWYVNDAPIAASTSTLNTPDFTSGDDVYCVVTPNDGEEDGVSVQTVTVTVDNTAPTIGSVTLAPDPAYEDTVLVCSANSVVDLDGDTLTMSYLWTVAGLPVVPTTDTLDGTYFDRDQAVQCRVTANDGTIDSLSVASNNVIISNTAPTATSVSIAPNIPYTDDTVSLTTFGWDDLDGDLEGFVYQWHINGIAIPGATSTSLPSAFYAKNNSLTVEATPDDGTDQGPPVLSAPVIVLNSLPAIVQVDLTPTSPLATDILICDASGTTDADGDMISLTYAWFVNSTPAGSGTNQLTAPAFGNGDSVYCVITPNDGDEDGLAVQSNAVGIDNTAPTIASVTLTPDPAYEDTMLSCAYAGANDADGDPLTFTYSWLINGLPIAATGITLDGTDFDRDDTVQCRVVANDGAADSTPTSSNPIVISNSIPSASSVSIAPTTPYTDDTVSLTTVGWTDLDGDPEGYDYQWYVNGIAVPGATSTALLAANHAKDDVLTVSATPNDGTDTGTLLLSGPVVVLNTPPVMASVSLAPNAPLASDTLICTGAGAGDLDGDSISLGYTWYVNGSLIGTTTSTLDAPDFASGDNVYCVVTPNDGDEEGAGVQSNAVTVANTAPTIASVTLTPSPAYEDTTVSCTPVGANDADGDALTFSYTWTVNGLPIAATSSTLDGVDFNRDDAVQCRVTANDGATNSVAVGSNNIVISNSAPSATSVSIAPTTPTTNVGVSLTTAGWSDIDGDAAGYDYQWYINGVAVPGATSTALLAANYGRGDLLTVQATPNDGTDTGTPLLSAPVEVLNTAPVLASASLVPGIPLVTDTLTCSASGSSDADGDSVTTSYAWYVNGNVVAGAANELNAPSFSNGDNVYCVVTPNDGSDDGLSVQSNTVTVYNTAPSIASVTLTPTTAYEDTLLTCTAVGAADADGDLLTYTYAWTINGVPIAATGSSLSGTDFDRDDTVLCRITANDGATNSPTVVSNNVVINNSIPSATSVSITPINPTTTDNVTLSTAGWSDLDGDTEDYDYQWFVNGIPVPGATSTTLLAGNYSSGDFITVQATPNEGTDTGTPVVSSAIEVLNTPPALASVGLSPANPLISDTLTCTPFGASDADGDSVTSNYAWFVNGSVIAPTTNTLDAPDFSNGDDVYCIVTPNDGSDDGASVQSNTVTVDNTAPTIASVTLTPGTAYEDTSLTCAPVGANDADGDALTFAYAWTVNGLAIGATSSTLDGADFDRDDTVQCQVTANDGATDSADVASNNVVINNSIPSASSVSIAPTNPTTNVGVSLVTLGWSDIDGDTEGYDYQWFVNGIAVPGATSNALLAANYNRGDFITVQAIPNDGTDTGTPLLSAPVEVLNSAPTLASASLSPGVPLITDTITCSPSGESDADGDAVSYVYAWNVNGSVIAASTNTLSAPSFTNGDAVYCEVTPTDGTDAGTAVQSNAVSIENTAPTIASATLTPDPAYEATNLTCAAVGANDADGDALTFSYTWTINGVPMAPVTSSLNGTYFDRDDTVRCQVTANDGSIISAPAASNNVIIRNTMPSATTATIAPVGPQTYDDVSVSVAGWFDIDGDVEGYQYQWYVNSAPVGGATTNTLSSVNYVKDDLINVEATPYDGTDTGTVVVSGTIAVLNTAPTLATAGISPASPATGDSLTCSPSGAGDDDGDAVSYTYAWFVNGGSAGVTTNNFTAPNTGDDVYCVITPTDGEDAGAAVQSSTITIVNSPPVIASVSLTPDPAYEASTLTCAASGVSDPDGDPLSLSYSWTVGGVGVAPTTSTLNGTYFNRGQAVRCTVIANDGGSNSSPVASNIVTIGNTAPSASSVAISPIAPQTDDNVGLTVSGWFDIDGDSEGYTYQWYVDGNPISGATSSALLSAEYNKGDFITVQATPFDGTDFGAPVLSRAIEVLNTPPLAPVISVTPTTPDDAETLVCNIDVPSFDADGDVSTYTYAWEQNGTPTAETGITVNGSVTSLGDVWTCIVTPDDGEDLGATAEAFVVITDTAAPGSPILDTLDAYDNDNTYDVTGSAELGSTITITAVCDGASGGVSLTTADATTGLFSYSYTVAFGESCTFTATSTDFFGNVSGNSNQVGTEICAVPDTYEGAGYGDDINSAIDEWGGLIDDGLTTYFLEGNILDNDPADWFVVRGLDNTAADNIAGVNEYDLHILSTDPSLQYTFIVHRGVIGSTIQECVSQGTGYDEYNDYVFDNGDGPNHRPAMPPNLCTDNSSTLNNCEDMGESYYIEVIRDPTATFDCTNYQITVTNGL